MQSPLVLGLRRDKAFDVICAGEALWKFASQGDSVRSPRVARLTPGGGPVNVALALAGLGLRVGVATVLRDDTFGRRSVEKMAALRIDVGGVVLARPDRGFVLVDASGGASQAPRDVEEKPPLEVPAKWSSQVLFLSGLSPVISHAAALCRAARAFRRLGAFVFIDFNASLHLWAGRDPRTIQMVLREVDAARCSTADLAVLGMKAAAVRAALRHGAVLVASDWAGGLVATGPFGEVALAPLQAAARRPAGAGDACTAAICAELARHGEPGESADARWHRALLRGRAAASAGA